MDIMKEEILNVIGITQVNRQMPSAGASAGTYVPLANLSVDQVGKLLEEWRLEDMSPM